MFCKEFVQGFCCWSSATCGFLPKVKLGISWVHSKFYKRQKRQKMSQEQAAVSRKNTRGFYLSGVLSFLSSLDLNTHHLFFSLIKLTLRDFTWHVYLPTPEDEIFSTTNLQVIIGLLLLEEIFFFEKYVLRNTFYFPQLICKWLGDYWIIFIRSGKGSIRGKFLVISWRCWNDHVSVSKTEVL